MTRQLSAKELDKRLARFEKKQEALQRKRAKIDEKKLAKELEKEFAGLYSRPKRSRKRKASK